VSANIDLEMYIMQENLCELRKIAGWTAEILANKLGVTKQTISNLETQKVKISRVQYIAIRVVFECEIAINTEKTTLRKIMGLLFEALPSKYNEHKDEVKTAMVAIASIASAGIGELQLYSSAMALLAPLGHVTTLTNTIQNSQPSLNWMMEYLMDENDKETDENIGENTNEDS